MSAPVPPSWGNGGADGRKAKSKEMLRRMNQNVNQINETLSQAREIYGPGAAEIKKLVSDSTAAVQARSDSVRAVTKRQSKGE